MRGDLPDALRRGYLNLTRGTLIQADDSHLLQEHMVRLLHGEIVRRAEFMQSYGLTSFPKKQEKGDWKAAELILGFVNGDRSHPLVLGAPDRRYRLTGGREGEVALHDDLKQKVHITRDGIVIDGSDSKLPITLVCGNAKVTVVDGKIDARVGSDTGPAVAIRPDYVYLGEIPEKGGNFDFVVTVSGPSDRVKARKSG